ncbi:hypothetical protein SK128_021702 [Halocaridina rubra]|uniref:Uncharacterized protein n=1 Tax=Halocaridina rubra TaxID=373956 RepID=A0AAN9A481_HALRR
MEEPGEFNGEHNLQITVQGVQDEGGNASPSSPSSPPHSQQPSSPLSEEVTQSMATSLVAKTDESKVKVAKPEKSQDMEQLDVSPTAAADLYEDAALSRSVLEVKDHSDHLSGGSWDLRPRCPSQSSSLSSSSSEERLNYLPSPRKFWERREKSKPVVGAPDLVMDLPVTPLSSSPKDHNGISPRLRRTHLHRESASYDSSSSSGGSSPGTQSPDMTAGEVFAKQNQCTLKKTPALKSFGGYSSDAQTQTTVPVKVGLTPSLSLTSQRSTDATELRITETEERVSSIVRSLDNVMQQLDSEMRSERLERAPEVRVEIRSAADKSSESAMTPSTPKLAARYLQAVAASTGGTTPALKPPIRVKPTVLKKPSLTRSSPDPEPSK